MTDDLLPQEGLVERLRAQTVIQRGETIMLDMGDGAKPVSTGDVVCLRNPDGPEAADRLLANSIEIEGLKKRVGELELNVTDLWHESEAGRKPLEHYLGMTWDEYAAWASPSALQDKGPERSEGDEG